MAGTRERKLPEGYAIAETRWHDLDKTQKQSVLQILRHGKAVSVQSAATELPNVTSLVLLWYQDAIVGVGTIKPERVWYAEAIQSPQKSGHVFDPKMLELGYIVVQEAHRDKKLSGDIANALLDRHDGPLFATTDAQNMKYTLGNRGFVQLGKEWKGKRGRLSLWLREPKS